MKKQVKNTFTYEFTTIWSKFAKKNKSKST